MTILRCFCMFCVLLWLNACTHYYYAPNTVQTPFLQDKGNCTVKASLGFGHEYTGSEWHTVYSPVKHIALMGNFFHASGAANRANTYHDSGKGYLLEGGLGAYKPLGKNFSACLFGGYGRGVVRNYYANGSLGTPGTQTVPSTLWFDRSFLQPSIAFQGDIFVFGMGFRLSHLRYRRGDIDYRAPQEEVAAIRNIEAQSPLLLPEMAYHLGFNIDPVVLTVSFTRTYVSDSNLHLNPANFSLAAAFKLDKIWKKTPK